uniref:Uncharacterized protein n=1 Tax=Talaromyces marneffei PM1 TaxID=1077442 RepID=A0A093V6B3_TALMA
MYSGASRRRYPFALRQWLHPFDLAAKSAAWGVESRVEQPEPRCSLEKVGVGLRLPDETPVSRPQARGKAMLIWLMRGRSGCTWCRSSANKPFHQSPDKRSRVKILSRPYYPYKTAG